VSTEQSGLLSSIYPPSTSTASATESPTSPVSLAGHLDVSPSNPEVNEVQDYDNEDISYRLRLLVKNNYFLPPAHSKPSPADLALSDMNNTKKSPRVTTPAFLDLFRVGKSKSKPTTPTGGISPGFDPTAPMLRATSDSITAPFALRSNQPLSSHQPTQRIINSAPRGRVVVVREKLNDMTAAAKQAEQDIKTRAMKIEQGSQKANPTVTEDGIDPTDHVDVPLLSPSYPFAVQASAVHGLGVLESLGADVLAERLPPPKNPNLPSQYDTSEDSWRKALLHQAVSHSLDNTPDVSMFSQPLNSPKSTDTLQSKVVDTPPPQGSVDATRILIQQKITDQLNDATPTPTHSCQKSQGSGRHEKERNLVIIADPSLDKSFAPPRVETPSGPLTPLNPPPRPRARLVHSLSQEDISSSSAQPSQVEGSPDIKDSSPSLRRTVSSPILVDEYDSSRQLALSPPPMPSYLRYSHITATSSDATPDGAENADNTRTDTPLPESDRRRGSLALSAVQSRPSLSEYSQMSPSPTTSTFQDMLNHDTQSNSSINPGSSRLSIEQREAYIAGAYSRSAMSPPPRLPSALSHVPLPPPPRSSSLNYMKAHPQLRNPQLGHLTHTPKAESEDSTFHISAPEPTTPPLPMPEQRSVSQILDPIDDSPTPTSMRLHSTAPGPSSPTSFFDSIQSQPNAMDDLDSSSDESEDEEAMPMPPPVFGDPRNRAASSASARVPQVMRLGNLSTPHLKMGESISPREYLPARNDADSKKPVSNIPSKPSKDLPASSYDFFKYAQENPHNFSASGVGGSGSNRRPATADHVPSNDQKAQESLRKLDGMLLRHIEDEKDTIKRIATHLKQTADPHKPPSF